VCSYNERGIDEKLYQGERRKDSETSYRIDNINNEGLRKILIKYVRGKTWEERHQVEFVFFTNVIKELNNIDEIPFTKAITNAREWMSGLRLFDHRSNDEFRKNLNSVFDEIVEITHDYRRYELTTAIS